MSKVKVHKPETVLKTAKRNDILRNSPTRFINREVSQLAFNKRVLEEAYNTDHPLLERLKFLAIAASNMDEFYMVRYAALKYRQRQYDNEITIDGLTIEKELSIIKSETKDISKIQQKTWHNLKQDLNNAKIEIVEKTLLRQEDVKWLKGYFNKNIYPALTPIAIDPAHPFPFLPNLGIAIIAHLKRNSNTTKTIGIGEDVFNAAIPLPAKLERFIKLPTELQDTLNTKCKKLRFILLEDIIELFQQDLFPGCKVVEHGLIKIIRDSDLEKIQDAEDLVGSFEIALKRRKRGNVIRINVTDMAEHLVDFIVEHVGFDKNDVFKIGKGMLGMSDIFDLYNIDRPELKFIPMNIRFPERINDFSGDCFAAIKAKDIVVHHPYESFDVVVKFLRQAANDPDVVAIKQTLYRTSQDSQIIQALITAAEAGKSVTALVELKARFDEEANIKWARDLERAGAQVIYGFVNIKTHAKISLVVRRSGTKLESYVHYGTGNYHPVTAKIYTDLSFFTCDKALCRDASHLFNYLTGYSPPEKFEKIIVAPLNLRQKLINLIEKEKKFVSNGKVGHIIFKANALIDPEIIDALYDASQAGVKIDLIIRGMCCLKPGIAGLSENITVKSIVGRFLEHSRIYCFGNGKILPSTNAKIFIASADIMQRNLDRRVEVMVPIENPTVHEQILGQIIEANLRDEKQSWELNKYSVYQRSHFNKHSFSAHEFFINNPSLSGRGTALHGKKS